jgi:uncharacterized membrane protein YccC
LSASCLATAKYGKELNGALSLKEPTCFADGDLPSIGLATQHALRLSRPLEVTFSAFYLGGFASFVVARLSFEILTFGIPLLWGHAWLSVCRCLALALVSFSIALATWSCRSYGRGLAIAFAIAHFVVVLAVDAQTQNPLLVLVKLCIDAAIIVVMSSPRVKAAFRSDANDSDPERPVPLSQSGQ